MARTLSRIARCSNWMWIVSATSLCVASLVASTVVAQSSVRVSPPANETVNPFAARRQSMPDSASTATVPPVESGVPKSYQNPFARQSNAKASTARRVPSGSLSRWRQLPQPLASVTTSGQSRKSASDAPRGDDEDLIGPLSLREKRATLFALPEETAIPNPASPPDPSQFGATKLEQPTWLVPSDPLPVDDKPAVANSSATLPSMDQVRAAAQPTVDPFEGSDAAEVVVSDDRPVQEEESRRAVPPVVRPLPPAVKSAEQWLADAEHAAADAASREDLASVVHHCKQGLGCRPERELAAEFRSLAAWACNRSGELESDSHRDEEALKAFELAIQWDPQCWLALHNRAVSRAQQGDLAGALDDFNRTLQLNPGLAVAYRNRGELLAALGRTEEAVADYESALDQLPNDAELYDMRGHALHRLGRSEESLADFGQSLQLAPSAATFAHRGNVYAEVGQYEQALADYRQALSLDAGSVEAHRGLAWLTATCPDPRFRNAQQALSSAQQAANQATPGDPFVLDALAAAHANAGQFDHAVRCQQEALLNVPADYSESFHARLALYQQHRPYRNGASRTRDENVRAASLEASSRATRQQ